MREHLTFLYGAVNGYEGRPSKTQLGRMKALETQLKAAEARQEELLGGKLAALNKSLEAAGQAPIEAMTREAWNAEQNP